MPGKRDAVEFKNYVEVPENNETANRLQGNLRIRGAIETIANFVAKIPEVNVTFEGNTFILGTQKYASHSSEAQLQTELGAEMDEIAQGVIDDLKENGFKSVTLERIETDFRPLGWGSFRNVLYTIKCRYDITSLEPELAQF